MPGRRKKRRSTEAKKPKLKFEESPVHIIHNQPSFVYSSDHPATAQVVPINDEVFTWVSPQFARKSASPVLTRQQKRQKDSNGTATRSRHRSQPDAIRNVEQKQGIKRNKFASLNFVGQEEDLSNSTIEEITFDDENEAQLSVNNENISKTNNVSPGIPHVSIHTPKNIFTPVDSDKISPLHEANDSLILPCRKPQQPPKRFRRDHTTRPNGITDNHDDTILRGERPSDDQGHCQRRLFLHPVENTLQKKTLSPKLDSSTKSPFHTQSKNLSLSTRNNSNDAINNYGSCFTPDQRRSSLRVKALFSAFNTSRDCQTPPRQVPVLVCDTPEEDYGLPVRLRRQKYKKNVA